MLDAKKTFNRTIDYYSLQNNKAMNTKQLVSNIPLKQEWNDKDFNKIKSALLRHFTFKNLNTRHGNKVCYTYADLENLLGLPYTSSSSCAGLWVTNTEIFCKDFPGYKYEGFAISNSGKCCAILWDKNETEIIIEL